MKKAIEYGSIRSIFGYFIIIEVFEYTVCDIEIVLFCNTKNNSLKNSKHTQKNVDIRFLFNSLPFSAKIHIQMLFTFYVILFFFAYLDRLKHSIDLIWFYSFGLDEKCDLFCVPEIVIFYLSVVRTTLIEQVICDLRQCLLTLNYHDIENDKLEENST